MELQYAPPAKNPNRVILVIAAGIVTTVLTLIGVYFTEEDGGTNIMGWHANYVIPVGAVLVGVCASLGYGIASYFTGLKIRKGLLWFILALQIGAYFAAQYVTFASRGPLFAQGSTKQLSFPEYFNFVATHFAWKEEGKKTSGEPLGEAGYLFIGLEILGFAAGSLIVPAALMKHPYCELCQMYMKRKKLATMAASVKFRKVKKSDLAGTAAYNAEQQAAYDAGQAQLAQFSQFAAQRDAAALRESLDVLKPSSKSAGKLPARIAIDLVRCRGCNNGHLEAKLLTGQGKKLKTTVLPSIELTRDFVLQFTSPVGSVPPARVGAGLSRQGL